MEATPTIDVVFIRHGTTPNNLEGRFAGRTNHSLTPESAQEISAMVRRCPYPAVQGIYRSPAARCAETLALVYPGREARVVKDLQELDFGRAEGMLVAEAMKLADIASFKNRRQAFGFPGGETMGQLLRRACAGIDQVLLHAGQEGYSCIAVITHSMLMDNLFRHCASPEMDEEQRYIPNGMGVAVRIAPKEWLARRQLEYVGPLPQGAPRPRLADSPYHNTKGG